MTIKKLLIAATFASAAMLALTPAFAEPANPDEDCDGLMTELKEVNDALVKNRTTVRSPMAICGAIGQLLGAAKATRAVADECFSDDKKRQDQVAIYEKLTKDFESQLGNLCK